LNYLIFFFFFFSSRRRHTRYIGDWSSDVCSSDLGHAKQCQAQSAEVRIFCFLFGWKPADLIRRLQLVLGLILHLHLCDRESEIRSEERRVGKECRSGWSSV